MKASQSTVLINFFYWNDCGEKILLIISEGGGTDNAVLIKDVSWYVFESIHPTCNLCQRRVSVLDVRKKTCLFCTYLSNTRQSAIPLNAILKLLIVFCMPSFNIQMHSFGCKCWVIFQVFWALTYLTSSFKSFFIRRCYYCFTILDPR